MLQLFSKRGKNTEWKKIVTVHWFQAGIIYYNTQK